jgi:hypothetical protein
MQTIRYIIHYHAMESLHQMRLNFLSRKKSLKCEKMYESLAPSPYILIPLLPLSPSPLLPPPPLPPLLLLFSSSLSHVLFQTDGEAEYIVKWLGFENKYATWEPKENFTQSDTFPMRYEEIEGEGERGVQYLSNLFL